MEGLVFNIQRFSIQDGPGIRTTVFLKGCNLHCFWCHNPESVEGRPQIQFFPQKCIGCGKCVQVCPAGAQQLRDERRIYERDLCRECGQCVEVCYAEALVMCGKVMTVEEVMEEVEKDRPYYENSGGGITFSGGEPLVQRDFLKALLLESKKRGLHTAVDTAGNVPWAAFEEILPYTDLFLYDIKALNEKRHQEFTGVSNRRILRNLKRLADSKTEIRIRVPVIPDVNDNPQEMERIASLLQGLNGIRLVELLPFHHLGSGKYESLGLAYPTKELKPPSKEQLDTFVKIFQDKGLAARRM